MHQHLSDLTADVFKDRKEFDAVRQILREAGTRHRFLFPAHFIFKPGNVTKTFESQQEASTYVREHITQPVAAGGT